MEHTTTAPDASIAAFAAAVRASLDDLPADEIDELVEGLESDLLDQASDSGEDFTLGDPDVYAAELRSAAGIPPRSEAVVDRRKPSVVAAEWVSTRWRAAVERMRRNAAAAWVIDLLVSLRPVWWLARGWADVCDRRARLRRRIPDRRGWTSSASVMSVAWFLPRLCRSSVSSGGEGGGYRELAARSPHSRQRLRGPSLCRCSSA